MAGVLEQRSAGLVAASARAGRVIQNHRRHSITTIAASPAQRLRDLRARRAQHRHRATGAIPNGSRCRRTTLRRASPRLAAELERGR